MSRTSRIAMVATSMLLGGSLTACGHYNGGNQTVAARPGSTGSRIITQEMILKWNVLDAYDAVERAGGFKLTPGNGGTVSVSQRRGKSSIQNSNADKPVLVVDGAVTRDYSMLRQIRAAQIDHIELLSSADATQRYGTESSGSGAILIRTTGRR